jgi:hypothetical protein
MYVLPLKFVSISEPEFVEKWQFGADQIAFASMHQTVHLDEKKRKQINYSVFFAQIIQLLSRITASKIQKTIKFN